MAITAFQKYVAPGPSDPNFWEAHKNLTQLYQQTGDLAAAIREVEIAIGLAPLDTQSQLKESLAGLRTKANAP
jgi:hypothetical protein